MSFTPSGFLLFTMFSAHAAVRKTTDKQGFTSPAISLQQRHGRREAVQKTSLR